MSTALAKPPDDYISLGDQILNRHMEIGKGGAEQVGDGSDPGGANGQLWRTGAGCLWMKEFVSNVQIALIPVSSIKRRIRALFFSGEVAWPPATDGGIGVGSLSPLPGDAGMAPIC